MRFLLSKECHGLCKFSSKPYYLKFKWFFIILQHVFNSWPTFEICSLFCYYLTFSYFHLVYFYLRCIDLIEHQHMTCVDFTQRNTSASYRMLLHRMYKILQRALVLTTSVMIGKIMVIFFGKLVWFVVL